MVRLNPDFAREIKKYGAEDFEACFNCGNCTAVCSLSGQDANFPRKIIRSGILGQTDDILGSRELWLCYGCGECSETCPRQAGPGEYMAAMRRYAIAGYEPTGLTRLIFKSNALYLLLTLGLSVILGFFLLTLKPDYEVSRWVFAMVPFDIIHKMGLIIFSVTGLSVVWGAMAMAIKQKSQTEKADVKKTDIKKTPDEKKKNEISIWAVFLRVFDELKTMKRFRECGRDEEPYWKSVPERLKPWFIHWSMMWGFIGLFAATALDFLFKDPATNIWLPSRIIGTLSGILLVYGASIALYYRINKITIQYANTRLSDYIFLIILWVSGVTGFWLEISVFFNLDIFFSQMVLLLHTIISMELVLLFAFSKFAHAVYRPIALFMHFKKTA